MALLAACRDAEEAEAHEEEEAVEPLLFPLELLLSPLLFPVLLLVLMLLLLVNSGGGGAEMSCGDLEEANFMRFASGSSDLSRLFRVFLKGTQNIHCQIQREGLNQDVNNGKQPLTSSAAARSR